MGELVFISVVFISIAQAMGVIVYYSKRNPYSKSAQNVATFLPAVVFVLLAGLGALLWLFLAWWVEAEVSRGQLFAGQSLLSVQFGSYVVGGAVANTFLRIGN